MRKIFANLKSVVAFAVVAAMTLSVSCMYDDTALTKRVDKVEKDLAALTERVNALENESLEDLLAGKLVITGVATDEATGNTVITLSDGSTVTVLAEAETLQYRTENGVLEISADGETWVAVTAPAECVVKSVVVNEDGSVTIVLADGTEATLGVAELIECAATRSQVYVIAETTKAVPFTINDAVEDINVMNQPFGWSATVEEAVEVEDDFGMGLLAAGGTNYVLNINGPSQALVNAGMAAKEGLVSVHFNTAAGACKVMNVAVNLAEITLNVDTDGNITITNTMATEQQNYWGEKFFDFADFYIGVMPKAVYDAHGVNALDEDYLQWGECESAAYTQRSTGLWNVADLKQYEEGVYEQEIIELTADQFGGAFWPTYNFEIGGEYVFFISLESKMTSDYYEIPTLNNAIFATYKKTIVEAELVEGSETWNNATYHVSLAGYDNFLLGWISLAEVEEYLSYGMYGSTVEEFLPQYINGYGLFSSGAIIAGSYLDQDINLADLASMSLMQWAPELSADTEYYFYIYPFNAQTEMDFYQHNFVPENLKICGTFATAALKAGSFDAGAEFELVMHEEKEIKVNVTFSEAVTSVACNWYSESFYDDAEGVNTIMSDKYYSTFVTFDEYTTYLSASQYDYYGLSNPIVLAIVALNADGEYVLVQKEFTYVEPQLPQVAITSFEYVARAYELDDDESTGGGDFVYDITCENGETFRLGLYWAYADAATGAILNGTYNYCYNALNVMYGGWDGFVIVSDTYYYDSKLTVTDDQIVLKLKGIAEYVYTKGASEPVEPEQPVEPELPNYTFTEATVCWWNNWSDFQILFTDANGVELTCNFWNCAENNFLAEGTYWVGNGAGMVYTDSYSFIDFNDGGNLQNLQGGKVIVAEVDGQYQFTFEGIYYGSMDDLKQFNGTYVGNVTSSVSGVEGMIVPSEYVAPEVGEAIELTCYSYYTTYGGAPGYSEHEMGFQFEGEYSDLVIDFVKPHDGGIEAGTKTLGNGTLQDFYCKYGGKALDKCEIEVSIDADGIYTFDVYFECQGSAYHFTYSMDLYA